MSTTLSQSAQELKRRLGEPDLEKIRMSPEKRMALMLEEQDRVLTMWRTKLRAEHPELSDLELTKLVFQKVEQEPIRPSTLKF